MSNSAHRTPADLAPSREPPRAGGRVPEGLVLLTRDRTLFQTVRAVAANHGLSTVGSETDLASELAAGHAAVAIVDATAAASPITDLAQRLAAQFPDLVLIVAGDSRDQGALTAQITDGTVHRFLHKPVSEQRVRLFVDAAWRRHEQEQVAPAPASPSLPTRPAKERSSRRFVWAGIVAAGLALAAGIWQTMFNEAPIPTPGAGVATPAGGTFYRPAASARIASDGESSELEQLLAQAEEALAAGRIDEAERLAAAARALQPDHVRVAFLGTQIGTERERALLTQARQAAAGGDVEGAIAVLEGAGGHTSSTLVAETRRELEQRKLDEQVTDLLRRAKQRASTGALIEPAQDNARFFIQSALALAPETEAVRAAQRSLAALLLETSRVSLAASDVAATERWLDAAQETGADPARLGELRQELQRVRIASRAANFARFVANFNERLEENRLREPAGDSAKHWLGRLVASDASHSATKAAQGSYAARVLAEGTAAVSRKDFEMADGWLAEARSAEVPDAEIAALQSEIARARQASSVVDASALQRVRYVEPRYPNAARQRDGDGWVHLEFTVAVDGTVGNVLVTHSDPAGVFDAAAVSAVRKWRYRPVVSGGVPVEQRARLRIRFTME